MKQPRPGQWAGQSSGQARAAGRPRWLSAGIVALRKSFAVLNLFIYFYSMPGKIAENDGGSGQWPKYSLRIIPEPSCPLLLLPS